MLFIEGIGMFLVSFVGVIILATIVSVIIYNVENYFNMRAAYKAQGYDDAVRADSGDQTYRANHYKNLSEKRRERNAYDRGWKKRKRENAKTDRINQAINDTAQRARDKGII